MKALLSRLQLSAATPGLVLAVVVGLVLMALVVPLPGWTIDLGSGRVEPPDTGQARTFAVDVRGEDVFIRLREQA